MILLLIIHIIYNILHTCTHIVVNTVPSVYMYCQTFINPFSDLPGLLRFFDNKYNVTLTYNSCYYLLSKKAEIKTCLTRLQKRDSYKK
jgi:hypothetical protein